MSDTKIEWADQTWNPVTGCTPISEGCANCYAARMARRLAGRYGYPKGEPFKPTFHPERLGEPYQWKKPQRIFVCSMADLFHNDVRFSTVKDVLFTAFGNGRRHTYMILTKRPDRMFEFFACGNAPDYWPLPNVWLGVTAENQHTADERIPILLQIPAAKRFVSVEPMLGPVDLTATSAGDILCRCDGCMSLTKNTRLDWVIAGPETGPRARPCSVDWVRDLQRQCATASVPFFDKKDVLGETLQEWPR